MNPRSGILAAIFCVVGAAIVVPLLMVGIYRIGVSAGESTAQLAPQQRTNVQLSRPRQSGTLATSGTGGSDAFPAEIAVDPDARLQTLIDQKNEQIARQQAELAQGQAELKQLNADYYLLFSYYEEALLAGPASEFGGEAPGADSDTPQPPAPQRSREELAADLQTLGAQLEQTREAQAALAAQLDEQRAQTTLEGALRAAAEQSLAMERTQRLAAMEALAESGEASLPILILMLRDQQPVIRGFAADVLRAMGPRAGDAVGALSELAATDPDEGVREAARRALRAIRD
jgi:hypothetical protein